MNTNKSIDSPSTATREQAALQIERDLTAAENRMIDAVYYLVRFDNFGNLELHAKASEIRRDILGLRKEYAKHVKDHESTDLLYPDL